MATLEVIDDPTANAALLRLLTGPRWRLGARDLARLGRRAHDLLGTADEPGEEQARQPGAREPSAREYGAQAGGTEAGGTEAGGAEGESGLRRAVTGIDPCDVVALSDALERPGHAGWSLEALRRVTAFAAELRSLRQARDEPLLDLVHRVIGTTGLDVELAASPEALEARRGEALAAFLDVVASFTDLDGDSSLSSFLAYLRAADEHERGLDTATPSGSDAVQLLTIHKAKGLEWDVVACPNLTQQVFPATRMRDRWPSSGWVLPGPLRGDAGDLPELDGLDKDGLAAFEAAGRGHLEHEERRLGYVAFTRARHTLIGSGHWWGPTQKKARGPSPFLLELKEHAAGPGGHIDSWSETPAETSNPLLVETADYRWPAPYAAEPLARREAAAAAVREGLLDLSEGRALPADDLAGLTPEERDQLERLDRDTALLLEEERTARRGVRDVALPATLSASQLLRLQADPDGFARELARPMPRPPAPSARRGTRFHAWVETLFEQRALLDPDDLPGAEDDGRADDDDLALLQAAFLASPWAARCPYAVEAPFALPLAGRVVRGRIDAVYEDATTGGWEVVDWKTGAETADPLQLAIYRLAWASFVGVSPERVTAAFLYVRTGKVVRYPDLAGEAELAALLASGPVEAEPLTLL